TCSEGHHLINILMRTGRGFDRIMVSS
uniref:Uncharacterized protein n=1 Tax=Amphimedon queenslandica TaxID=400682 RepID=A0A1X7SJJ9_AMPQE